MTWPERMSVWWWSVRYKWRNRHPKQFKAWQLDPTSGDWWICGDCMDKTLEEMRTCSRK
jgi:hypothetical protein